MATNDSVAEALLRSIEEEVEWVNANRAQATESQAQELFNLAEAAEKADRLRRTSDG